MLINLINTALIACGMAANTTDFNFEKKTRKNAESQINLVINYNQNYLQEYVDGSSAYYKYTITGYNQPYANQYMQITDTTYIKMVYGDNNNSCTAQTIYNIHNYYNTYIDFELVLHQSIPVGVDYYWGRYYSQPTEIDLDQYYNMTMTSNINSQLAALDTAASSVGWALTETGLTTSGSETQNQFIRTNRIRLGPNEDLQLYFKQYTVEYSQTSGYAIPNSLQINGTLIQPDLSYNIIDVPGLMLNVLTLPFSFISQAFNLTIFPGTPYQLNFSNLFRTIIAIFVLLWLIRKIFK